MADETLTARDLGRMSRAAVGRKDRDGWLDLFAPDGFVQDPVGASPFDPEGKGHHGREAIAAFYDTVIAPADKIEFEITQSYLAGDEVADVGVIRTTLAGGKHMAVVRLVQVYRSNGAGKLASLRAFWEFDATELVELTPGE
jgi:ketosteroid isomerase-like protein